VRNAVRTALGDLRPGDLVLAACSGGADSLALAAALAFAAPRAGLRAGGVTVDHGLQDGSAARAADVGRTLGAFGLDPVVIETVSVDGAGGPEAAARAARYAALEQAAGTASARAVLLGHTLDDQAETVLLGLARGSGARSLAGMPARRGIFRRPLLSVRRSVTREACAALGLDVWDDPHNCDKRYARVRVRHDVLPVMEQALGPGVAEALARTAGLLRADAEVIDTISAERLPGAVRREGSGASGDGGREPPVQGGSQSPREEEPEAPLAASALEEMPEAVRTRVLRSAAIAAGCPAGALTAGHVDRIARLVTDWHGQRWVDLPGRVRASRQDGRVLFASGT
jgi:tRNA(Ile)-lysidine synthase